MTPVGQPPLSKRQTNDKARELESSSSSAAIAAVAARDLTPEKVENVDERRNHEGECRRKGRALRCFSQQRLAQHEFVSHQRTPPPLRPPSTMRVTRSAIAAGIRSPPVTIIPVAVKQVASKEC